MYKILLVFILILLGTACNNSKSNDQAKKLFYKDRGVASYEDKLRMPIDINGNIDTINRPIIKFEDKDLSFDTINLGEKANTPFKFVNDGNRDLYILDVQSSCGCTIAEYTKDAIKPGESSIIHTIFNSENKKGIQHKIIKVFTNTYPNKTELKLHGYILVNK